jgi:hypothetical protein
MEAVNTSITSVNLHETTRRIIQEDCLFYARFRDKLKQQL